MKKSFQDHRIENFKEVYNKLLLDDPTLKEKVAEKSDDNVVIKFHEYLSVSYDGDTAAINQGLFRGFLHVHGDDGWFFSVVNGEIVFLEDTRAFCVKMLLPLRPWRMRTISREEFEQNKEKLVKKKNLRIYTSKEIIK